MKEIVVRNGLVTRVDDDVFDLLQERTLIRSNDYVAVKCPELPAKKRGVYLHRWIMSPGSNEDVHHRDGDRLNNTRENLQVMSNGRHTREHCPVGKSGYRGVFRNYRGERWAAKILGQRLGSFATAEEAAAAVEEYLREHDPL